MYLPPLFSTPFLHWKRKNLGSSLLLSNWCSISLHDRSECPVGFSFSLVLARPVVSYFPALFASPGHSRSLCMCALPFLSPFFPHSFSFLVETPFFANVSVPTKNSDKKSPRVGMVYHNYAKKKKKETNNTKHNYLLVLSRITRCLSACSRVSISRTLSLPPSHPRVSLLPLSLDTSRTTTKTRSKKIK